ncbi:MAG: hypothetical protein R3F13_07840 [Prosthecobacter sp.]
MPACQIEDFYDTPPLREELVQWLAHGDAPAHGRDEWCRRLEHWWDENPFASLRSERGWVLRYGGGIVGFLGLIPTCYAVNGVPTPAFIASTWRIDEEHRNASLPMLMRFRKLSSEHIVSDTTPTPKVKELLERGGWHCLMDIRRYFIPLGLFASLCRRREWPSLPADRRLVLDPSLVKNVDAPSATSTGVEKWITPEYLRWFAASEMRRHQFVGLVDDEGCLTSYLFLAHKRIRGIPAWMEIDHFTTVSDHRELYAIVGELVRRPSILGGRRLLSLAAFPGDGTWDDAPVIHRRSENVCHCFAIPASLKALPKHTVLAEGDWGL